MRNRMSLTNLDANYQLSVFSGFLQSETNWLFQYLKPPIEVLFIPFAYNGTLYNSYIQEVKSMFLKWGITLKLITEGTPKTLIEEARGFVIGGGDLEHLLTGIYSYMSTLRAALASGKPCLAWNEGSVGVSPSYVTPPMIPVSSKCIAATKYQLYTHYIDNPSNRLEIKNFLLNHKNDVPPILEVGCMIDSAGGSGIRLEDDNVGLVYSEPVPPAPTLRFTLNNIDELKLL